jgi:hypothetical protein
MGLGDIAMQVDLNGQKSYLCLRQCKLPPRAVTLPEGVDIATVGWPRQASC